MIQLLWLSLSVLAHAVAGRYDCVSSGDAENIELAVCSVCDCCLSQTVQVCQIYLAIYIGILLAFLASIICYKRVHKELKLEKEAKQRPERQDPPQKKSQQRGVISVYVLMWISFRIAFLSTSFFEFEPSVGLICSLELLQDLPVLLMFFCILLFHRFLLNIYAVILKVDLKKRQRQASRYFWIMSAVYTAGQVL